MYGTNLENGAVNSSHMYGINLESGTVNVGAGLPAIGPHSGPRTLYIHSHEKP